MALAFLADDLAELPLLAPAPYAGSPAWMPRVLALGSIVCQALGGLRIGAKSFAEGSTDPLSVRRSISSRAPQVLALGSTICQVLDGLRTELCRMEHRSIVSLSKHIVQGFLKRAPRVLALGSIICRALDGLMTGAKSCAGGSTDTLVQSVEA
jgi:hypothetical protein